MKIKSLKLNNFARFTDFEIEYDDKITKLIGINGSGKTTLGLTAFWACMKGISEKCSNGQLNGERFRFIGSEGKSADIELTLIDTDENAEIKVINHITTASNQIRFEAPDDYQINNDWFKNLLSVSLMSAKNFTDLGGRDQALLLGIDTSDHDEKITAVKSEYTLLNRDLKNLGNMEEVEEVESVDITKLIEEKQEVDSNNANISQLEANIAGYNKAIIDWKFEIKSIEERIIQYQGQLQGCTNRLSKLANKSTNNLDERIGNCTETNKKAQKYEEYRKWLSNYSKASLKITSNREELKKRENARLNYIKSFDFGIKGLTVDDKGSLLLNEKPLKNPYFSRGELELIVAKLHVHKNPNFKVRFLDDFDLLDESNQTAIIDSLLTNGFQVITAEVGEEKSGNNSILLRECKVVNDE